MHVGRSGGGKGIGVNRTRRPKKSCVAEGKRRVLEDWFFQPDDQPDVISQPDDQPDEERSYKHLAEVSSPCKPCN
jgi:hypothetical protein